MRAIALVVALGACAHNVPQDLATGKDGNVKGAVPIALENNAGQAVGIVTYPGGDRVDWRSIELPADKRGTLALKMTYATPRPGLAVAFDVFDQWNTPLAKAAYQRHGHTREALVEHAKGRYYVRVYAPRRGDAGKYKLVADFVEDPPPDRGPQWQNIQIPDPPRLAEVPTECTTFDVKNDTCKAMCDASAPPSWPGCGAGGTCPDPMDPANAKFPACQAVMHCGPVPDVRIKDCTKPVAPPPPPPPAKPVTGRMIKQVVENGVLHVWIGVGSSSGVDKSWTAGTVLRTGTTNPLANGTATIVQVNKTTTELIVHVTADVMTENDMIRIGP